MNIIITIYNKWADMILSNEKPYEFRTNLGKEVFENDKVFIYECQKFGGKGKIVGEFEIEKIIMFRRDKDYIIDMLETYIRNFAKNTEIADILKENRKKAFSIYNTNKVITNLLFIILKDTNKFDEDYIKTISSVYAYNFYEWLQNIGFCNEQIETNYRYALKIKNAKRYDEPIDFQKFIGYNDKKVPRSWIYVDK